MNTTHELEISGASKKNVILDATVLSALMSCPRMMEFSYVHNLREINGKSSSLEMGQVVHTALETFYKNIVKGEFHSIAVEGGIEDAVLYTRGCSYCVSEQCDKHQNEWTGVKNTEPKDIQIAYDTIEQYFDYYKNDHWIPLEVETVKGQILYEDDEIRILWKAKFDLIADTNQGIFPIDHKTSKQRRPTLSLNNQFMGQCVLSKTNLMFVNKIGFQTSLKPNEKFERVAISYADDRLVEWKTEILPYYAKLLLMYHEGEYFPPNFTHCESKYGKCRFADVCSSNRNLRESELRANFIVGKKWDVNNRVED